MSDYRIIRNVHGFAPQERHWYGWDGLTKSGSMFSKVIICTTVEDARAAIEAQEQRRAQSKRYTDGAIVEYWLPRN